MRQIGTLQNGYHAKRFVDFLFTHRILAEIESESDGTQSVWVQDDDDLPAAREHLARFESNPDDSEYMGAASTAERLRAEADKAEAKARSTVADAARIGYERSAAPWGPVTMILVAICLLVEVLFPRGVKNTTNILEQLSGPRQFLYIEDVVRVQKARLLGEVPRTLAEVRKGEVWRLVTPIFLHSNLLHLIFNLMWLWDLGRAMEGRFSSRYLLAFVMITAILSNLLQFFWAGPFFGGMSGVNYALFGFLWIRGKYGKDVEWQLNPSIVTPMLIWYFVCLTGLLGPVANAAHTGGLLAGMAWGFATSKRWPWLQKG